MTTESGQAGPTELSGAWNFRDVGSGSGVTPGLLYRASALSALDATGRRALAALRIHTVIDLRSRQEIESVGPDAVPSGVEVINRSFDRDSDVTALHEQPRLADDAALHAYMVNAYRWFPKWDGAARAILAVADALIDERRTGGVLVHCAAGKDRTGWVVAAILAAAGVDCAAIMDDYLRSNDAQAQLREALLDRNAAFDRSPLLLGVRAEYLAGAFEAAVEAHGSFAGYLETIGVGRTHQQRLARLL
jgi:protein-tyrosine phosphatase